jgi:catechol 2,3-dioxygenase-like lactoylglutathione lyase family enzyme
MHTVYTVSDLQASFKSLTAKLGAAQSFATERQDDGAGHVEKNGSTFALVYTERGEEISRVESTEPDEILYHLVEEVAVGQASDFEVGHRRKNEDSRRQWFALAESKLRALNPAWGDRYAAHVAEVLSRYPFVDKQ